MSKLVLDSSAVTALAKRSEQTAERLAALKRRGVWPPVIPSAVLAECLSGRQHTDAAANHFIKSCKVDEALSERVARKAGTLRTRENPSKRKPRSAAAAFRIARLGRRLSLLEPRKPAPSR